MAAVIDRKANLRDKRAQGIAAMGLVNRDGDRFRVKTPSIRGRELSYEVWRDETGKVRCSCVEFEENSQDAAFRCEHILAVKHAIRGKSSEVVTKATSEEAPPKLSSAEVTETGAEIVEDLAIPSPSDSNLPTAPVVPLAFTHTLRVLRHSLDPSICNEIERANGAARARESESIADVLDRVAPTWSYAVRNVALIGEVVVVTAAITIDGVTREGLGTANARDHAGVQVAEREAFRQAGAKFGLGRDLRDTEVVDEQRPASFIRPTAPDPLAKSAGDLVSPKQLGIIRGLGREANLDVDVECQRILSCSTDELSKRAASSLISHLEHQRPAAAVEIRRAS